MTSKSIKRIAILGARGIPAYKFRHGGYETIAEELATGLAQKGFEVYVSCESRALKLRAYGNYMGVRLVFFPVIEAIRNLSEVFLYDALSVIWATFVADMIYMLGYSSVLALVLPKLFGTITAVNVDGLEARRRKFNRVLRFFYRTFEILNTKVADYVIVDSHAIGDYYQRIYGVRPIYIPNSVSEIDPLSAEVLENYHLQRDEYYLVIARLIPDNNIDLIIEGFKRSNSRKKLVIVGPLYNNSFVRELLLDRSERIAFLGGIYQPRLQRTLRHNCFAYIHGHEQGGTNPSLVEALSCSNIILSLDVLYNREVAGAAALYYKKDPDDLKKQIEALEGGFETNSMRREAYAIYKRNYTKEAATKEFIELVKGIEKKQGLKASQEPKTTWPR